MIPRPTLLLAALVAGGTIEMTATSLAGQSLDSVQWTSHTSAAPAFEPGGIGLPLGGAVLGWPAGVAAGAALGYLVGPRDDVPQDCMFWCIPSGPVVGGLVGSVLGPSIGAHLMNGREGNPFLGVLATGLAGAGAFLLVRGAVRDHEVQVGTAILLIPIAQIGTAALVEWATAR